MSGLEGKRQDGSFRDYQNFFFFFFFVLSWKSQTQETYLTCKDL